MTKPAFTPGVLVVTQRARDALASSQTSLDELLRRHTSLDHGEVPQQVLDENTEALLYGDEHILSVYSLASGVRVCICSEGIRPRACGFG